jgi:uncharacterized membrane protein YhaH (DUF805 family)
MDIQTAFRTVVLEKYVDFQGRASRSEFWWYVLAYLIIYIIASIIDSVLTGGLLTLVVSLGLLLPNIAVAIRRLHDTDRTGWWLLLSFIPLINLVLIYFYVLKGTDGENRFGPDPLA